MQPLALYGILALLLIGLGYALNVLVGVITKMGKTLLIEIDPSRRVVNIRHRRLVGTNPKVPTVDGAKYVIPGNGSKSYMTKGRTAYLINLRDGTPFELQEDGEVRHVNGYYLGEALSDMRVQQIAKSGDGGIYRYIPLILYGVVFIAIALVSGLIFLASRLTDGYVPAGAGP